MDSSTPSDKTATRDPSRIRSILVKLERLWSLMPDMRLGQLIWNLADSPNLESSVWEMEEDELSKAIDELSAACSPVTAAASAIRYIREHHGASSCTFYVRAPTWTDEVKLLVMLGVKHTEQMYGFLYPPAASRVISSLPNQQGINYEAFEDASIASGICQNLGESTTNIELTEILESLGRKQPLFGSFADLENVKSMVRLVFCDQFGVRAILFVNFEEKQTFTNKTKNSLIKDAEHLESLLDDVETELTQKDKYCSVHLARMIESSQALARIGLQGSDRSPEDCFNTILDAALDSFNIGHSEGFGTVHLYDRETLSLRLVGHRGAIDNLTQTAVHPLPEGRGTISWVALKRRSILVSDLVKSPFKKLHIEIADGIRSQLAVPMFAGNDLLGVINLESKRPNAFDPNNVSPMWYAATQAALACRQFEMTAENLELTELSNGLLRLSKGSHQKSAIDTLNELAELARSTLSADSCDLWRFDVASNNFDRQVGQSKPLYKVGDGPRDDGWTHFVCRAKIPVWISEIESTTKFDVLFWDSVQQNWHKESRSNHCSPPEVNEQLIPQSVRSELGIPILQHDLCVGVAWLKYKSARIRTPTQRTIDRIAESLVGHLENGLVDSPPPASVMTSRVDMLSSFGSSTFPIAS